MVSALTGWKTRSAENAPPGRFLLADALPIIVCFLCLAGWLTTTHVSPWVSWHAELPFFAAGFGLALLVVVKRVSRASPAALAMPLAAWPLLVFAGYALLQQAAAQPVFGGTTVVVLLYLALAVICICLGATASGPCEQPASAAPAQRAAVDVWLACVLLLGAVLSVGIGLAQVLLVFDDATWVLRTANTRRAAGNLGQPNHLATLLVMALASAVYLHTTRHLGRRATALCVVFLLVGLVATGSRSGLLGLATITLWWVWKQPKVSPLLPRWWALVLAMAVVAIQAAVPRLLRLYDMGVQTGVDRIAKSASDPRLTFWPQLAEAVGQRPWFGWGMRSTAEAHATVVHAYDSSLPLTYSHNLIMDLALWGGLPLAALMTVGALYWLWIRARGVNGPKAWFGMAIALPLAVHSMLEFPFAYAYLLAPAMVGVGLVEAAAGGSRTLRVKAPLAAILVALPTSLGVWSVVEYLQAEQDFQLARFEMLRIGPEGQADHPARLVLLTQLGAVNQAGRLQPRPQMSPEDIDTLRRVADHYAWSGARYRYATALALNGQAGEAARQMQILRAQHGAELHDKLLGQLEAAVAEARDGKAAVAE